MGEADKDILNRFLINNTNHSLQSAKKNILYYNILECVIKKIIKKLG